MNSKNSHPSVASNPQELLRALKQTGASLLPPAILVGAILEIVSDYNRSTSEKISEWGMVGESFLKGLEDYRPA